MLKAAEWQAKAGVYRAQATDAQKQLIEARADHRFCAKVKKELADETVGEKAKANGLEKENANLKFRLARRDEKLKRIWKGLWNSERIIFAYG